MAGGLAYTSRRRGYVEIGYPMFQLFKGFLPLGYPEKSRILVYQFFKGFFETTIKQCLENGPPEAEIFYDFDAPNAIF